MKASKALFLTFTSLPAFSIAGGVNVTTVNGQPHCEVTANGDEVNDVPNILKAFEECGSYGTVTFPEDQEYWIAEKLNPVVKDVVINWSGKFKARAPQQCYRSSGLT